MDKYSPDIESLIKKSKKYLKKRDFYTLSHILTAKVPMFTGNAELFYYLGIAQFYLKNFKAAEDYFKTGMQFDGEHVDIRLAAAVALLRQRESGQAVKIWLEILDIDPDNKKAHKGLNMLRQLKTPEDLARYIRSGRWKTLMAPLPSYISYQTIIAIVLTVLFLAGITVLTIQMTRDYFFPLSENSAITRTGAERYDLSSLKKKDYVGEEGSYHFQFSPIEIRRMMAQAKLDFNEYKDNKVRFDLNKIKFSNASAAVKAQASVLRAGLEKPNFTNLDTNYSYKDVFSDPMLYDGVYVSWRGKVQNVQFSAEAITFTLLVGYDSEQVLEGDVLVSIPFEIFIDPVLPTEVLGEIKVGSDKSIRLIATSIHQIVTP